MELIDWITPVRNRGKVSVQGIEGWRMRPLIYATFITLVLAVAGVVQATVINQLDGKSLLCKNKSNQTNPYFGLVFDAGKVSTWIVVGH